MNLKEQYQLFLRSLSALYSSDESAAIAAWVLEAAGIHPRDMITDPQREINLLLKNKLQQQLDELLQNKPVQYVLGEAWFYQLKFNVNEHVLIPRPETEELVQLVIQEMHSSKDPLKKKLLDVGTGSGCIAITLKKNLPAALVSAIDVSDDALSVAVSNALLNDVSVAFNKIDFLNEKEWSSIGEFDVIVSNPPYIPLNEKAEMDKHVIDFEPHIALFVPENDPLLFYKKLAMFGKNHLKPGGKIFLETHAHYAKKVADHLATFYTSVNIIKDISGNDRMIIAF